MQSDEKVGPTAGTGQNRDPTPEGKEIQKAFEAYRRRDRTSELAEDQAAAEKWEAEHGARDQDLGRALIAEAWKAWDHPPTLEERIAWRDLLKNRRARFLDQDISRLNLLAREQFERRKREFDEMLERTDREIARMEAEQKSPADTVTPQSGSGKRLRGRPRALVFDGALVKTMRGELSQAEFIRVAGISSVDILQRAERGRATEENVKKLLAYAKRGGNEKLVNTLRTLLKNSALKTA